MGYGSGPYGAGEYGIDSPYKYLTGTLSAAASLSGAVARIAPVSGAISAVAALVGDLIRVPVKKLTGALSASTALSTPSLIRTRYLRGNAEAVASLSGMIRAVFPLAGTITTQTGVNNPDVYAGPYWADTAPPSGGWNNTETESVVWNDTVVGGFNG